MKPWSFDPIVYCEYYKKHGCAHVDGYLCNIMNCSTLKEFLVRTNRRRKINKIYDRTSKKIIT